MSEERSVALSDAAIAAAIATFENSNSQHKDTVSLKAAILNEKFVCHSCVQHTDSASFQTYVVRNLSVMCVKL